MLFRTFNPTVTALIIASALAMGGPIKTPDCGGRGQRPCHPLDSEFYFNSATGFACDRGLKIDIGNFFKTSDDQCVNDNRQTGNKDYSWVGWALAQQRYGIGRNEPINWVTTLNAHNAYNTENDNYPLPDQKYSMTDLLNWGVRSLELDVHWAYGQALVCHGQPNHAGCASWDRLYAYAIREIGEWLDANPGEIVHIDFEDRANSAPNDVINKPIEKWLGNKVYRTVPLSDPNYPYGVQNDKKRYWPTMGQIQAAGKQVVITSSNTHGDTWIWPSTELGYGDRGSNANISGCGVSDGTKWYQRDESKGEDPRYWSRIYEGRAVGDSEPLLYEDDVRKVTNCGIGIVSLGYLNALDDAPLGYRRSGADARREAMIWSWAPGEDSSRGNLALMRHTDGRWLARPNDGEKHRFACYLRRDTDPRYPGVTFDPTTYPDPKGLTVFISHAADVWQNGDNVCWQESAFRPEGRYVFGAPRNANMNETLFLHAQAVGEDVWLNYSIKPIPTPAALPAVVYFNAAAGSQVAPPPQVLNVYSLANDTYSISVSTDPADGPWLQVSTIAGHFGQKGAAITVSVDMARASLLKLGSHPGTITVTDTTLKLSNRIPVSLRIKIPTSVALTKSWPADGRYDDTLTLSAKVNYTPTIDPGHGGTVKATGAVVFRELIPRTVQTQPLDPATGQPGRVQNATMTDAVDVGSGIVNSTADNLGRTDPDNTVSLRLTHLSPGPHRYAAYYVGSYDGDRGYAGDSTYGPSASDPIDIFVFRETNMVLAATPTGVRAGERVTLKATVVPKTAGDPLPTGSVTFSTTENSRTKVLGTTSLVNGVAQIATLDLPIGLDWISASYSGDSSYVRNDASPVTVYVDRGNPVTATVNISPAGALFQLDGTSYASPKTFTWQVGSKHQLSVAYSYPAGTGQRRAFQGWADSSELVRNITVEQRNYNFTGVYALQYLLTLTRSGSGSLAANPPAIDSYYTPGQTVEFYAVPSAGWVFGNWTGDLSGDARPGRIVMNGPKTVGAVFSLPPQLTLTIPAKTGTPSARTWTLAVTNSGQGASTGAQIVRIALQQVAGAACSPAISTPLPIAVGTIAPGATRDTAATLDFSGCVGAARFTATFTLSSNGGSYTTSAVVGNQFR